MKANKGLRADQGSKQVWHSNPESRNQFVEDIPVMLAPQKGKVNPRFPLPNACKAKGQVKQKHKQ